MTSFVLFLQVVELDFLYPSEGIHRRWENGYRITSTAATADQTAIILSTSKRKLQDVTQETLRTSAFPSTHVKVPLLMQLPFQQSFNCRTARYLNQQITYASASKWRINISKKTIVLFYLLKYG